MCQGLAREWLRKTTNVGQDTPPRFEWRTPRRSAVTALAGITCSRFEVRYHGQRNQGSVLDRSCGRTAHALRNWACWYCHLRRCWKPHTAANNIPVHSTSALPTHVYPFSCSFIGKCSLLVHTTACLSIRLPYHRPSTTYHRSVSGHDTINTFKTYTQEDYLVRKQIKNTF